MRIVLVQVCRRPPWPLWAVSIVLAWCGLGAGALFLSTYLGRPVQLCLLKCLTGFPCPTCGFTRGALSIVHGHIIQGWLYNPLLYSALGLFLAVVAVRVILARAVRVSLTPTERRAAWILAMGLFFANWAYVVFYVG